VNKHVMHIARTRINVLFAGSLRNLHRPDRKLGSLVLTGTDVPSYIVSIPRCDYQNVISRLNKGLQLTRVNSRISLNGVISIRTYCVTPWQSASFSDIRYMILHRMRHSVLIK